MFYEPHKYDTMVSWKKRLAREAPFFREIFEEDGIERVLDFGCGTGAHVDLFSSWGVHATGIDSSREMIEEAKKNKRGHFFRGTRARGKYDAITCLGNTLPHFFARELNEVLASFRRSLERNGLLIIQSLNYDRILAHNERFIAASGDRKTVFLRFYDFGKGYVMFNVVEMRWDKKWVFDVKTTKLNPIRKRELEDSLGRNGFGDMRFYGDFGGTPFTKESLDLICTAKRKT
jgi:SAM-dependent methyltransferase